MVVVIEVKCPECKRIGNYIIEDNYFICKCGHDLMEFKKNG